MNTVQYEPVLIPKTNAAGMATRTESRLRPRATWTEILLLLRAAARDEIPASRQVTTAVKPVGETKSPGRGQKAVMDI